MNKMFENYPAPADYIPDNRQKCHKPFNLDIMVGETSVHSFDIPFNVDDCKDYQILYKLGIREVLIKKKEDIEVTTEKDNTSILTCILSPLETRLFDSTILDTHVQIKFVMKDDSVLYSEIYKIHIRNSLDDGNSTPSPVVNVGFGWTED